MLELLNKISPEQPVLIAGPTASGKSSLALEIAQSQGGVIVNGDAMQVYSNWRVLTARPTVADESRAPHLLYGHIGGDVPYSVGEWLREVVQLLGTSERPIIVGGTGLYFSALSEGLAEIPPTPAEIRQEADALIRSGGLHKMLSDLDDLTVSRIDTQNPVRVQRAWEVFRTTGRGLADWQINTPAPILPLSNTFPILVDADRDWLADRIEARFDMMLDLGALDEAADNLPSWDPTMPSSKAIGAKELIAHLHGEMDLDAATDSAKTATRQYAKRQRTWFRARMKDWNKVSAR